MKNKILFYVCLLSFSLQNQIETSLASPDSEHMRSARYVRPHLRNQFRNVSKENSQNDFLEDKPLELVSFPLGQFDSDSSVEDPSLYELGFSKMSLGSDKTQELDLSQSASDSIEEMLDHMSKRLVGYDVQMAYFEDNANNFEQVVLHKKKELNQLIEKIQELKSNIKNRALSFSTIVKKLNELFLLYDTILEKQ